MVLNDAQLLDLQSRFGFSQKIKTFYVATVDGDKPKVKPFGLVMEFEGKFYFSTNDSKPSNISLKQTRIKNMFS